MIFARLKWQTNPQNSPKIPIGAPLSLPDSQTFGALTLVAIVLGTIFLIEPYDSPRENSGKGVRLIHTHGRTAEKSIETNREDTGDDADASTLAITTPSTVETINGHHEDSLSTREASMRAWQESNADLWWNQIDGRLRNCTHVKFINGLMNTPDDAIDECLRFFEQQDAERQTSP